MSFTCKLWKIVLGHDMADDNTDLTFWGYHFSEGKARDAALNWAEGQKPGSVITIKSVDLIK
jgi:hypothetical protein